MSSWELAALAAAQIDDLFAEEAELDGMHAYQPLFSSVKKWEEAIDSVYDGGDKNVRALSELFVTSAGVGDDRVVAANDSRYILTEWYVLENVLELKLSKDDMLLKENIYQYASQVDNIPLSRQTAPGLGISRKRGGPKITREEPLIVKDLNSTKKGADNQGSRLEDKASTSAVTMQTKFGTEALNQKLLLLPALLKGNRTKAILRSENGGVGSELRPPYGNVKTTFNLLRNEGSIVYKLMTEANIARKRGLNNCFEAHEALVEHSFGKEGGIPYSEWAEDFEVETVNLESDQRYVLAQAYRRGLLVNAAELAIAEASRNRSEKLFSMSPVDWETRLDILGEIKIPQKHFEVERKWEDVAHVLKAYFDDSNYTTPIPLPIMGKARLYRAEALERSEKFDVIFGSNPFDVQSEIVPEFLRKRNLIRQAIDHDYRSRSRIAPFDMVVMGYLRARSTRPPENILVITSDEILLSEVCAAGAIGIHPIHDIPYLIDEEFHPEYPISILVGRNKEICFGRKAIQKYGLDVKVPTRILYDGQNIIAQCPFIDYDTGLMKAKHYDFMLESNIGRLWSDEAYLQPMSKIRLGRPSEKNHKPSLRRTARTLSGRFTQSIPSLSSDEDSSESEDEYDF